MVNLSCGGGGEWSVFVGTGCVMDDGRGRRGGGGIAAPRRAGDRGVGDGGFYKQKRRQAGSSSSGGVFGQGLNRHLSPACLRYNYNLQLRCDAGRWFLSSTSGDARLLRSSLSPCFSGLDCAVRACVPASPGQEGSQSNPRAKQRTPAQQLHRCCVYHVKHMHEAIRRRHDGPSTPTPRSERPPFRSVPSVPLRALTCLPPPPPLLLCDNRDFLTSKPQHVTATTTTHESS
jgi:hypothetical protein